MQVRPTPPISEWRTSCQDSDIRGTGAVTIILDAAEARAEMAIRVTAAMVSSGILSVCIVVVRVTVCTLSQVRLSLFSTLGVSRAVSGSCCAMGMDLV